jgi:hypothetical protein
MREWMFSQRTGIAKTQFRAPCIFIGLHFGHKSCSPPHSQLFSFALSLCFVPFKCLLSIPNFSKHISQIKNFDERISKLEIKKVEIDEEIKKISNLYMELQLIKATQPKDGKKKRKHRKRSRSKRKT